MPVATIPSILGKHFWINILLTLFGYIPGIVHAVYIIAKR
ncbi:MAG TPA: YqaE/Pmp3 family membrane protein [Limnobacter sp.]|nr:YqaE/Pmp3 family membrane protein [Limnobacter sp.]